MKVLHHHSCMADIHFVIVEDDGVFYEVWSTNQTQPSLYISVELRDRYCNRCQKDYVSTVSEAAHIHGVNISSWKEFLDHPASILTRMLL